jgi:hypothetical protein
MTFLDTLFEFVETFPTVVRKPLNLSKILFLYSARVKIVR